MSEMIDESDITRQIPLVAGSGSRRGARCPTPGQLAAYADTRLDATARARVEEHLADCTYCLGQVGFLVRELRETEARPVPSRLIDTARERPSRWFRLVPVPALAALAATALLLVVGFVWQPDRGLAPFSPAGPGAERSGRASTTVPMDRTVRNGGLAAVAPRILLPVDGEVVGQLPMEIRWSSSPGALQYSVQVLSLAGDLVWEGSSAGEATVVPSAVAFEPGQRYYVWVEARLPSGATSKSDAVAFRVAPD
jgi:hypothetical protein